jgi:hypothetical protein
MAMIMDDYSKMKWRKFLKKKGKLCASVLPVIKELNSLGKSVAKIRMNNAGENKQLADEAKQISIIVEFTAPNIPQQDDMVEHTIVTVLSRARAKHTIQPWFDPKCTCQHSC